MAEIKLESLYKEFSTPDGIVKAVNNVDLVIKDNEFFTFVGPSGCGKTTTLRMIAGLETPTSGSITFDGNRVTDLPPQERDIAMIFQNVALYPHMTSRENMGYPLKVSGETDRYEERITEVARMLEIEDQLNDKPSKLSGGQQQRVALGRAIIRSPSVILFDEPMSDLDAELQASLRVELMQLHEEVDSTMVYVTHDQEEAMTMSDRIGVMRDGELIQVGSPAEIYDNPKNIFVSQFIGFPGMNIFEFTLTSQDILKNESTNTTLTLPEEHMSDLREAGMTQETVMVGFRPEQVSLTSNLDESYFTFDVDVWEHIGSEIVVHLKDTDGNRFQVTVDKAESLEFDALDKIGVGKISQLYFFDPNSREKILQLDFGQIVPEEKVH